MIFAFMVTAENSRLLSGRHGGGNEGWRRGIFHAQRLRFDSDSVAFAARIDATMKKITAILCAAILVALVTAASAAQKIQHVVSFKFKATATADDVKKVETSFADLKNKIPQIKSLQWGTNISPEKLNKGFTHCWVLTFNSAKDRDTYLDHPDHKAFGKNLSPVLEDVFVIDFVVEK
jgi:hypothetical protein